MGDDESVGNGRGHGRGTTRGNGRGAGRGKGRGTGRDKGRGAGRGIDSVIGDGQRDESVVNAEAERVEQAAFLAEQGTIVSEEIINSGSQPPLTQTPSKSQKASASTPKRKSMKLLPNRKKSERILKNKLKQPLSPVPGLTKDDSINID